MFTLNFYNLFTYLFDSATSNGASDAHKLYKTYDGLTSGQTITNAILRMMAEGMLITGLTNREDANNRVASAGVIDGLATESDLIGATKVKGKYASDTFNNEFVYGFRSRYPTVMILGSGSTAPQKTDYRLEEFIGTDILQCVDNTFSANENFMDDTTEILMCNWDFQNVSENDVTVSEIGLITGGAHISGQSGANNPKYLIYREVLAQPLVMHSGDKYTFSVRVGC